jgi:hypothetical protein
MFIEHSFLEMISGFGKYCNERLLKSLHHNRYAPVNDFKEESGYGTTPITGVFRVFKSENILPIQIPERNKGKGSISTSNHKTLGFVKGAGNGGYRPPRKERVPARPPAALTPYRISF